MSGFKMSQLMTRETAAELLAATEPLLSSEQQSWLSGLTRDQREQLVDMIAFYGIEKMIGMWQLLREQLRYIESLVGYQPPWL